MKTIAEALVYAATYIDIQPDESQRYLNLDVKALESISAILTNATDLEKGALASAAESLFEQERRSPNPRQQFMRGYASFMEEMFDEGWDGNKRI